MNESVECVHKGTGYELVTLFVSWIDAWYSERISAGHIEITPSLLNGLRLQMLIVSTVVTDKV